MKQQISAFIQSTLTLSMLALVACAPASKNSVHMSNFVGISSLNEVTQNCQQKIRQSMASKTLRIPKDGHDDAILVAANNVLNRVNRIDYQVRRSKDQNVSLIAYYLTYPGSLGDELSYDLSLSEGNTDSALNLEITYKSVTVNSMIQLTRDFKVNRDCTMTLAKGDLQVIKMIGSASKFHFAQTEFYSDGGASAKQGDFEIPTGHKLMNFFNGDVFPAPGGNYACYFSPDTPVLSTVIKESTPETYNVFGRSVKLIGRTVEMMTQGQVVLKGYIGRDPSSGFAMWEMGDGQTWTIPLEIWNKENLGSTSAIQTNISYQLPENYFKDHASYILIGNIPNYDHRDAYWKATKSNSASDAWKITETSVPKTVGNVVAADLASNDTIQTTLPEIQKIKAEILAKAPTDKKEQIGLLLKWLSTSYTFDEDMVSSNIVRPLTTKEALDRKKGVCQHYSVIFTAAARALGIPTRIVTGYHIRDGFALHAWVEVSIEKGLWQVVEPQLEDALTNVSTRFYFPLERATNLEDKNSSAIFFIKMLQEKFEFKPVQ